MAIRLEKLLDIPFQTYLTERGASKPTHQFVGWERNSVGKTMRLRCLGGFRPGAMTAFSWPDKAFVVLPELLNYLKPEYKEKLGPLNAWPVADWAHNPKETIDEYSKQAADTSVAHARAFDCEPEELWKQRCRAHYDAKARLQQIQKGFDPSAGYIEGPPGPELMTMDPRKAAKLRDFAEAYGAKLPGFWEQRAKQDLTEKETDSLIAARVKQVAETVAKHPLYIHDTIDNLSDFLQAYPYPPAPIGQVYTALVDIFSKLPQTPNKETDTMITISTKTFANGQDLDTMSSGAIYDLIAAEEAKIEKLGSIKRKPKMLTKEIEDRQAGIEKLVAYLDEKKA